MSRENYRRWPWWHFSIMFFWSPWYLNPVFFKDWNVNEDGFRVFEVGVSFLFFTIQISNFKKERDVKAGFV